MSEREKLTVSHLRRAAFVYVRQSSRAQLERNVESTARQYALVARAVELGFAREQVVVIDEDLGISGSGLSERSGFARLTAEVALGHAGLVLGLEVSRLARNNVDWYRLLDLCGVTDTVIGDADGLYHPGSFNDRLLLGLKGTMSEAELHVLRSRLEGGIRNKAQRGELRRGLPVGLVWGEEDGEVLLHPDEAIRGSIATIFDRFAELGSVRQVWLWMRSERVQFPQQRFPRGEIVWVTPTYHQVHSVLENPVYAGAYAFGKTRRERYVDEHGQPRTRIRRLPQPDWDVLIWNHHPGFIDKTTFDSNRERIAANTRPRAHEPGGAVREGSALLQGIAVCGRCGRKLKVHYQGRHGRQSPAYHCPSSVLVEGRGRWCLRVGGAQIDQAVADALLAALTPAGIKAALAAAEALEHDHDAALSQWRLQVERAQYQAERAERRYRQVEPEHRLVARGLERDWEQALTALQAAQAELELRERQRPRTLTPAERGQLLALGADLGRVWAAPTTSDRDRKQLLRTLIEDVILDVAREERRATVTLRWRGGALTELAVPLPRQQPTVRTDEDTIELLERLAAHYPDATIAGILNRQGRRSATGERFTQIIVGGLRRYRGIAAYQPPADPPDGELLPVGKAADVLGVAASTIHRWLQAGFIPGEQDTPGAPWRIRVNDQLRALFVESAPAGYVPIVDAMRALGVSRQTVLQRVKRGELQAIHVRNGRRKGLRIRVPAADALFDPAPMNTMAV
ncbi:MAG: recombinase family protein [Actinomycetota bacterium]|nr:recombinase family protein [Actinomycetota bacterium]